MFIPTGNRRRAQMKRPKLQHDSAVYLVRITTFSFFLELCFKVVWDTLQYLQGWKDSEL